MVQRSKFTHHGMRTAMDAGVVRPKTGSLLPHGYLRSIPCVDCPAEIGEACISSTGKSLSQVHISRRRLAIRKYRSEQEES